MLTFNLYFKHLFFQTLTDWSDWTDWSGCEMINSADECGPNATNWRQANTCVQSAVSNNTESAVDEFWCGEEIFHIQSCFKYCEGTKNHYLLF